MANKTNGHKGAAGPLKGKAASMTKQEALRRALIDLGKDAPPLQLQAHIKDKFGIEISTNHISAAKTDIVRKMAGGAKPLPAKSVAKTPAAPKSTATSNGKDGGTVALADVQTVNTLVGRVGANDLKTLIDLLVK